MGRRLSISAVALLPLSLAAAASINGEHLLEERGTARVQHMQIPALEAAGMAAFVEQPVPFSDATHERGHTLQLSRVPGDGPASRYTSLLFQNADPPFTTWADEAKRMREGQQAAYLASYPKGTSPIHNALNVVYLTNVTVGGQDFKLVLDTGSSDTWVVSDPFQCREGERRPVQESYCKLSKHYTKTATFRPTDLKMKTAYADGEMLEGEIGYDNVSIGGVAVNSAIGLVHDANWNGDGQSSGLLGMAFPTITRAFNGKQVQRYDPVFFSMHKQGLVPPVFSVALGRHNEEPGALSLGGLPDTSIVQFSKEFASAPMEYLRIRSKNGAPAEEQRTMYIATVQSFTINGVNVPVSTRLVVDTGTTFSYIPSVVVEAIKAAWSPPLRPVVNAPPGMFLAPCDSTPPKIKLNFNGRSVEINGQDLFVNQGPLGTRPEKGKLCTIGIGGGQGFVGEGLSMMGGTFMKSLVAVFDVGAAEMRFHQRVRKGGGRAAVEFDA